MDTTFNPTVPLTYSKRWAALFVLCTAQFMVIMDTSIIGVALPAIKEALGYSQTDLQWIFNAYVIFFGGLLLLGGRLSDIFGAKNIFITGFLVLAFASLLAGVAWSEASMNTGRALQGFGSALIAPAALTLVMNMFTDPKELGKAFGFWGASAAAGGSAGVFLGGVITEWMDWRWVFFINIPMALLVLILSPGLLQAGFRQKGKIDIIGSILVTLSLVILVYALVTAEQAGWSSFQTIGLIVFSLVLFAIFVLVQKYKDEPLVHLSIFSRPNLSASNIVMGLLAGAWIPLWFYLNLYLQQILKFNALNSGLALLPMTIVIMILMVGVTGKLVGKYGFKPLLIIGLIMLTISLLLFSQVPVEGSFLVNVLPASIISATGMSLAYIPATIASMSGAKPEETGLASGIVNTSYQIGSAIGLAIVVAVASAVTNSGLVSGLTQMNALNEAFQTAFLSASIIAGLASVVAIICVKQPK